MALSYSKSRSSLETSRKALDEDHYELENGRCDLQGLDLTMMDPASALTRSKASPKGHATSARSHLAKNKNDKFESSASKSKISHQTSKASVGNRSSYNLALLGQLAGYSSSEDEAQNDRCDEETELFEHHRHQVENKSRKGRSAAQFKSAELVVSDADSSDNQGTRPVQPPILLHRRENNSRPASQVTSTTTEKTTSAQETQRLTKVKGAKFAPTTSSSKRSAIATAFQIVSPSMAIASGRTVPKRQSTSPRTSMKTVKRPKLRGGFLDEPDSDDDQQVDNDHDLESKSSSQVMIYEEETDRFQDDEDKPSLIPATPPPRPLPVSTQRPSSRNPGTPAKSITMDRFNKLMAEKEQNKHSKHMSSSTPTVQVNRTVANASSGNHAQVSVRVGQGPRSSGPKVSRTVMPVARQGMTDYIIPRGSKVQQTKKAPAHASLRGSTSAIAKHSQSTSGRRVSDISRPIRSSGDVSTSSETGLAASTPTFEPAPTFLKKSLGVANGVEASHGTGAKNRNGKVGLSPRDQQSSTWALDGAGVVGDLLQDIRKAGEPLSPNGHPGASQCIMQNEHHGGLGQAADRLETIAGTKRMQAEDEILSTGTPNVQSNSAPTTPLMAAKEAVGHLKSESKHSKVQGPDLQLGTRTVTPQALTTGSAISKLQTFQSTSFAPKRKAITIESSSVLDFPASKKRITTKVLRAPTTQSSTDPQNVLSSNDRKMLSSTVKLSIAASPTQNKPRVMPSTPATKTHLQFSSPKTAVYKTLLTPPITINEYPDQSATSKPNQLPIPEQVATTSGTKVKSSGALDISVGSQAVISQPRPGTLRKTTVSVNIPAKTKPVDPTNALRVARAPEFIEMAPEPKPTQTSVKTTKDDLVEAPPQACTSRMQQKVHQVTTRPMNWPTIASECTLDTTSAAERTRMEFDVEKRPECLAKGSTAGSTRAGPSTASLAAKPATSITAQPAADFLCRMFFSNAADSHGQDTDSRVDAASDKLVVESQQAHAKAKEKRAHIAVSTPGLGGLQRTLKKIPKSVPRTSAARSDSAESHDKKGLGPRSATTAPETKPVERKPITHEGNLSPLIVLSNSPAVPGDAEPYFEYSVFRKIWSDTDGESSIVAAEITLAPCTNIEEANAHTEALFNDARQQYQQHFEVQFSEWVNKPDEHGCNVFVGTFAPIDHPSKKSWMKYWVRRDQVSAHAGRTAEDLKNTSFVAKTIYVLRLFRLQTAITDSEIEEASNDVPATRVYQSLPRTECYTTLDAANRAAKSLQVELSHKQNPSPLENIWQTTNLADLSKKVSELQQAKDEDGKYWKSEFNGSGLGSATFELIVEKAGLCGPRNL